MAQGEPHPRVAEGGTSAAGATGGADGRASDASRRLRLLADSQRELAGLSTDPEGLYDRIARIAQQAMDGDGAAFEMPDGEELAYRASAGLAASAPNLRLRRDGSLSGLALATGQSQVCADSETDPRVDRVACRAVGLRSMVVGVLSAGGRPVGVIKVMSARPDRFGHDDLAVMDVFVGSLGAVLERLNRQRAQETALEQRARILGLQQQMAASDAPLQALMQTLSEHALALTGATGAVVELVDGEDMVYAGASGQLAAHTGYRLRRAGSLSGACASQACLLESPDTRSDPRVDAAACEALGVRAIAVAPLLGMDGVVGVLKVISDRPHAFSADHVHTLHALVQSMGVVIQRRAVAERVARSEQRYRILFAHNPHPMWVYDMETLRFLEVNAAAVTLYGYTRDEFLQRTILDIRPPEDREELSRFVRHIAAVRGLNYQYQSRHQLKDGSLVDVEISGDDIEFDGRRARLVLALDVTARRRAEREKAQAVVERERVLTELEQAAAHDALTGLPRFTAVSGSIDERIAAGVQATVLLVELDRFAALNQTLTHEVADQVLRVIGVRLGTLAGPGLCVCHLAGDEFVVVAESVGEPQAQAFAERLRAAVAEPVETGGVRVSLTATVGISRSPEHGDSATELLRRAEAAAERGKAAGRDCVHWFSAEAMQVLEDRITLGAHLRGAVERGELRLMYQPLFRGRQGRAVGAEALLRWDHPTLGSVSPARFIPVAENLGLMGEIGDWVIRAACAQLASWRASGLEDLRLSVNVSSLQLQRPGLVATVRDALVANGLPASVLELEITESALMENLDRAREKLQRFSRLGVSVALDDFGTGYSSLAYLKELELHKLKIDKSFVRGLPGDEKAAAMARTIVSIAHQFGLTVAAEGVETPEQALFLEAIGCDLLQGFLLSRPLEPDAAAALLARTS